MSQQVQKINYQKELEKILKEIERQNLQAKPTLLLHACCGPCSSYVIEYLSSIFDITIYYYNPNIHPQNEYERRLHELEKFLTEFPDATKNKVKLVVADYNPEDFFSATKVREEIDLQTEPERGERCRRCYTLRMKKAFDYACQNNFDWFTTTLSISPYKDSKMINEIGKSLEESELGNTINNLKSITKFLTSDFKKKNGFLRSTQLSQEYGLWRQDYCGCIFSKQNLNLNKE